MASRVAVRERDERSTRDLILDAAEKRFAEKGFSGVSVREIAGDAGLKNQASLYHHFKNKQALYEAVLERGVEPIFSLVVQSASGGGLASLLGPEDSDPFLDGVLIYLAEHPHLPRLIQRAGLDDSKFLRVAIARFLKPLYNEGLKVLEAAGGPWDPKELPHLAFGLYLLIFGYFANAGLAEAVLEQDPRSAPAIARQRQFLKTAVARLLGVGVTVPRAPTRATRPVS